MPGASWWPLPLLRERSWHQLLPREECRRSRRLIFILAPAVTCPASPTLGQLWSGIQPVPFSILEALLRIKNRSNDGKESEQTAALSPPSCQGLNEPSGSLRVMRVRVPAGVMTARERQSVGRAWAALGRSRPRRAGSLLWPTETRGNRLGLVSDQTFRTVKIKT